jgi:hypothetical protein
MKNKSYLAVFAGVGKFAFSGGDTVFILKNHIAFQKCLIDIASFLPVQGKPGCIFIRGW